MNKEQFTKAQYNEEMFNLKANGIETVSFDMWKAAKIMINNDDFINSLFKDK